MISELLRLRAENAAQLAEIKRLNGVLDEVDTIAWSAMTAETLTIPLLVDALTDVSEEVRWTFQRRREAPK